MESGRRAVEHEPYPLVSHALETVRAQGGMSKEQLVILAQALHDLGDAAPESVAVVRQEGDGAVPGGRARKISVSMPEDLSAAVQQRVGRGEFSRYVTEAVASRLEADLLTELVGLLDEEHGEIPESLVTEAEGAWPDAE